MQKSLPFTQLSFTACRDAGTDCAEADAAITAVAAMNASFESLFIFLLSKLRLPQVYCEPVDDDKSYIARSITLVRHKKRGAALCRLRAASNFQCVGILPYRSLPTKKNPPHPNIAYPIVVHAQHRPAATFRDCQASGTRIARHACMALSCATPQTIPARRRVNAISIAAVYILGILI